MSYFPNWSVVAGRIADGLRHAPGTAEHDIALARLQRMADICDARRTEELTSSESTISAQLPGRVGDFFLADGAVVRR